MQLPMNVEDITVEWLNSALRSSGRDVTVRSLRLGTFIGGAASKVRLHLDYETHEAADGMPVTVVLKTCLETGREALMDAGLYHREAAFYREARDRYDIRTPKCYFSGEQRDPAQAVIILEDLGVGDVHFGSALRPYSANEAASALEALAVLHARSMRDPHLADLHMPAAMNETRPIFDAMVRDAPALFKSARGCSVAVALHDVEKLAAALNLYQAQIQSNTSCLLHGDAHIGNTYIGTDGKVGWLDWQLPGLGHWVHDVAYFMGGALDIPDRRRHEQDLLTHYLDVARSEGADMPTFDDAWRLYRGALFYGFIVWLGVDPNHQPETICTSCLSRFGTAMLDHDTYGVLGV